ncbi:Like-Sm (LSM) domain [Pseudocohnilembus persalinus]|uniref:Small nuclear ribonucleoprotein Sm D2 n=1 Tax=Pseudocohnilembus persalinus TaxID=266149 RepID=A0A0V0QER4_PSEPJ|nr:Like-Sm (LSM) domain [Pseudocohnilembus persalinus]|eukprot:KRX00702.1 Like-Sm (LSM) domain [Pseudocohnilembus persalinus]
MAEVEPKRPQEETFDVGPFELLTKSVKSNAQVLILLRNNRKMFASVRAFDRHMNMVLENVTEIWTEVPRGNKGKKAQPVNKERYHSKIFLRGDSVIFILYNPK